MKKIRASMSTDRELLDQAVLYIIEDGSVDEAVEDLLEFKAMGIGALIGATGGAMAGYREAKKANTSRWRGVFKGAALGAGAGALGGALIKYHDTVFDIAKKGLRAARKNPATVLVGAPTLLAVSDLVKTRGSAKDMDYVVDAIRNKDQVASKQFVDKIDKKIIVATNSRELYNALKKERKLVAEVGDNVLRELAQMLGQELRNKSNAFALRGEQIDMIGVPAKTNANVIAHEVGHILDFRKRGMTMWDMKEYKQTVGALFLKYKYEQQTMTAEKEAWRRSPSKETEAKSELSKHALNTYEKGFHARRASLATAAAMLLTLATRA